MIKYFLEASDVVPVACEWDTSVSILQKCHGITETQFLAFHVVNRDIVFGFSCC